MQETVFLTGGAGRIGKRLLKQLLAQGYHVKVLVHNHEPEGISSNNMTLIRGDLCDRSSFSEAVQGCDFVCHLAAIFDMSSAIETDSENDHLFEHFDLGNVQRARGSTAGKNCEVVRLRQQRRRVLRHLQTSPRTNYRRHRIVPPAGPILCHGQSNHRNHVCQLPEKLTACPIPSCVSVGALTKRMC